MRKTVKFTVVRPPNPEAGRSRKRKVRPEISAGAVMQLIQILEEERQRVDDILAKGTDEHLGDWQILDVDYWKVALELKEIYDYDRRYQSNGVPYSELILRARNRQR